MTMKKILILLTMFVLGGCAGGMPKGITPVQGFELDRYLGQWYEVARLDHSFERGLEQVTATYKKNEDGSVAVINRGFSTKTQKWSVANGKAKFVKSRPLG